MSVLPIVSILDISVRVFHTVNQIFGAIEFGDYRVICELRDKEVIVLVVTIGHRRDVYND